jgi:hypothetical protein
VGVGTTLPKTTFQVGAGNSAFNYIGGTYGSAIPQLLVSSTSTGEEALGVQVDNGNNIRAKLFLDATNNVWGLSQTYGNGGNYSFVISHNGGEYLRIDTNGNMGIGTTTPLAKFDVRNNSIVNSGTIPTASFSGQTTFAGLVVDNSGKGDIFTASSSGLSRFVITQAGNVGYRDNIPNGALVKRVGFHKTMRLLCHHSLEERGSFLRLPDYFLM